MNMWKYFLRMAAAAAESAGEMYINKDDNNEGMDDVTGQALKVVCTLINAILSGNKEKIENAINSASDKF